MPRLRRAAQGRRATRQRDHAPADLFDEETLESVRARHAGKVAFVLAFPTPTSAWRAPAGSPRAANPLFMEQAAMRVRQIADLCDDLGAPYLIENPKSSMLNRLWRRHDHAFPPYEYGGYLDRADPPALAAEDPRARRVQQAHRAVDLRRLRDAAPQARRAGVGRVPRRPLRRPRPRPPAPHLALFFKTSAEVRSCTPRGSRPSTRRTAPAADGSVGHSRRPKKCVTFCETAITLARGCVCRRGCHIQSALPIETAVENATTHLDGASAQARSVTTQSRPREER